MKTIKWTSLLALFVAVVFVSSCQKDNGLDNVGTGQGTVNINLKGVANAPKNNNGLRASVAGKKTAAAVQRQSVKVGNWTYTATLREVGTTSAPALRASAAKRAEVATPDAPVPFEGDYTISVYNGAVEGEPVATHTFTTGDDFTFSLDAGSYNFVATALGNPEATGADQDPLAVTIPYTVQDGEQTLDITLLHQLTEVSVIFDATNVGTAINSITGGTVEPNQDFTFNTATGVVDFTEGTNSPKALGTFAGEGMVWTSAPVLIATDGTGAGVVKFAAGAITIGGNANPAELTYDQGWDLQPATQYELSIVVGEKEEEEGNEVNGLYWAPGNLVYNDGEYGFAETQFDYGDMWYWNWPLPEGVEPAPQSTDMLEFDPQRDPCRLVAGGEWRTPSKADVQALLDMGTHSSVEHITPDKMGVYMGRNNEPAEGEPYVFLPVSGSGTRDFFYWVEVIQVDNNAEAFRVGQGGYSNAWGNTSTVAPNPIRCIRDAN